MRSGVSPGERRLDPLETPEEGDASVTEGCAGRATAPTMRMRTFIFAAGIMLAAAAAAAAACASSDTPERGVLVGGENRPGFQWGSCEFDIPVDASVDCGYLTVPEDRSQPERRQIRLHVGVFRTKATEKAPDPILYLGGGPGENSTEASSYFYKDY